MKEPNSIIELVKELIADPKYDLAYYGINGKKYPLKPIAQALTIAMKGLERLADLEGSADDPEYIAREALSEIRSLPTE